MITLTLAIDMPKGCGKCPFFRGMGETWKCSAIPGDPPHVNTWENYGWRINHRLENCPLVEKKE